MWSLHLMTRQASWVASPPTYKPLIDVRAPSRQVVTNLIQDSADLWAGLGRKHGTELRDSEAEHD